MCTPSRREAHIGQKRVPGERESRRLAEKYNNMQKTHVIENVQGLLSCGRLYSKKLFLRWSCGKELCSSSVEALVCFNFGSLASYWPRPWSDFGVPLGAGRPPKWSPGTSKRQDQTTQTASLECLWGAFGGRASRGGPGASRRQPRRPKMGLPQQRRAGLKKTPKNDEH